MEVSVIIPTFNRAAILARTLQDYGKQTGDHCIREILVMDDGSRDDTRAVVEQLARDYPLRLRYLHQENGGLSSARNHAFREAEGDLILFGDDDIIPAPNMVAEHVAWHRKYPAPEVGILGYVTWAPSVRPTPFMKWSGERGPQFNFGYFEHGQELEFQFGYFCNTTVKAAFLKTHGQFDETFRQYGWEDIELSYRLNKHGYRLIYNHAAVGFHNKFETFENTRRRVENMYKSWPVFGNTAAGQHLRQRWSSRRQRKSVVRQLLRPLKASVMPLVRPFADSRIPLPEGLYDMLFYHYVKPLSHYIAACDNSQYPSAESVADRARA
jgi:GT2 family glycosyltransferase